MLKNKTIVTIFLTIFIDLLGYGILIPIIPQLFANPGSAFYLLPSGMSVKTGYLLLGLLIAAYPIGQFIATPILGQLSDRYGRKKILGLSLLGTSISYIVFAIGIITKNIPILFISRFFDGLTGGNVSVAQAMIADVSEPKNRARNFGLIGAAFGLGFIFGPYLGGRLSDPATVSWFTAATPFYFAGILAFLNMLSVVFLLKETNKHMQGGKINWTKSISNIKHAWEMKGVNIIYLTNFLFYGGFSFFTTFFAVYLINKFNFTQGNIGDFFAYVGIWSAITQLVITRAVSKRFPEQKVVRITLVTAGVLVLAYFLPQKPWEILLIPPFFGMMNGLSMANLTSLLSRSVGPHIQGEVLGMNASVQSLAQAVPAILSGFIASSISSTAPIVIASVFIIFSGVAFRLFYKPVAHPTDKLNWAG
jgi:DHA1 family tetracycline resistance protein-like MFS transporter